MNSGDEAAANKALAEINKHRDVPAYSSMFCQTMGIPDMMDAPLKVQEQWGYATSRPELIDRLTDTFGHMTAAASTLYDESTTQPGVSASGAKRPWNLREQIHDAVIEAPGRATVLDAFMTAEGTVYDTDFLIDLASDMEKIPSWPDEQHSTPNSRQHDQANGGTYSAIYLHGHSTDPLAAVLHGMGNNPEAANLYFAPPDTDDPMIAGNDSDDRWVPSTAARNRMQLLASREWSPEALQGLSAAFASASAERTLAPGNDKDERATWATANGITILGQQSIPDGEVKHNVGVMLGNCGPEVTRIADGASVVPTADEDYKTVPITIAGGNAENIQNSLAHLIYDVSDSPDANFEIIRGTTAYTAARASAVAEADGASAEGIKSVYDSQANVISMLRMLDQEAADSAYNGAAAATGLLSVTPGVGPIFSVANSGITLSGSPEVDLTGHDNSSALLGSAYTNAFNQGLIFDPPDPSTTSWYSADSNGGSHITLENQKQVDDFYAWIHDGAGNSPSVKSTLNEIGNDPETAPWQDVDEFKDRYGGKNW